MDNLWTVDAASGKMTRVDTDTIYTLGRDFNWSADSKWITFERFLPNRMRAISVYSMETGTSMQVTDGMSDAQHPAFDRDGQYLYFMASTNYGPTSSDLDMTSDEHQVTSNVYLAVLPNNLASPLAPESDEEAPEGGG
jgi:tricorn protease